MTSMWKGTEWSAPSEGHSKKRSHYQHGEKWREGSGFGVGLLESSVYHPITVTLIMIKPYKHNWTLLHGVTNKETLNGAAKCHPTKRQESFVHMGRSTSILRDSM